MEWILCFSVYCPFPWTESSLKIKPIITSLHYWVVKKKRKKKKKDKVNVGDLKSTADITAYYLYQRMKGDDPVQICIHC